MSFFRRDQNLSEENPESISAGQAIPAKTTRSGAKRSATTHIAAGSRITGEIVGTTDLIVDGHVDGRLELEQGVVVGPSGFVKGEIEARSVRVAGKVDGNVRGSEVIEILANGSIQGDVTSPRVVIADGAFFKGQIEMNGSDGSGDS